MPLSSAQEFVRLFSEALQEIGNQKVDCWGEEEHEEE